MMEVVPPSDGITFGVFFLIETRPNDAPRETAAGDAPLTGLKDDAKASYYRWVAPYYYESGNKARAVELIELALKLVGGLPVPDNTKRP